MDSQLQSQPELEWSSIVPPCQLVSWLGCSPSHFLPSACGQYLNVKNDLTLMVATEWSTDQSDQSVAIICSSYPLIIIAKLLRLPSSLKVLKFCDQLDTAGRVRGSSSSSYSYFACRTLLKSRQMIDSFCGWATWEFDLPNAAKEVCRRTTFGPSKLLYLRAVNELWQISRITWLKMGHIKQWPNCSLVWCELAITNGDCAAGLLRARNDIIQLDT